MKAAWYDRQGRASDVLKVGETPIPKPAFGEVRIRLAVSGINPGDVKKRQDAFGVGMPYPRVIPHSDGAGVVDAIGDGVAEARLGERVWCFGAQSYRPFGTAAEYAVVRAEQAVPLPEGVSFEQGACLGIPGITAHRAVHVAGSVKGRVVLVQGAAGAVGQCAVVLACQAGARVIATVLSEGDRSVAIRAGAHHVVSTEGAASEDIVRHLRAHAPEGIDHVVEVAFDRNVWMDESLLRQGGSIAAYATSDPTPPIPFWPLLFKNASIFLLGSDNFSQDERAAAAWALNDALASGWAGFDIAARFPLEEISAAHEAVEEGKLKGRVVVMLQPTDS
jgi:NADPH2:quinone reductase